MATKSYISRAGVQQQVNTHTIGGTAANGQVYTVTENLKSVTYTATGSDTNATITTSLLALLQATQNPEFQEKSFSYSSLVISSTASTYGVPFTQTSASSGTGTLVTATSTANVSPNDMADANNWSGAALPANSGDTLVFEENSNSILYGLETAFSAKTFAAINRYKTFTGTIGEPIYNPNGYREYRGTTFTCAGVTTMNLEVSSSDGEGHLKFAVGSAGSCTVNVFGETSGTLNEEIVWWSGTGASNVVNVNGGSILIAPLVQSDSATLGTVNVQNGVFRATSATTFSSATITQVDSIVDISSNITTWNIDEIAGTSTAYIRGSATFTTLTLNAGTLVHLSSGGGTTLFIGNGATADFSQFNSAITITNVTMAAGATWNDPAGRVTITNGIDLYHAQTSDVTINTSRHINIAFAAF